MAIVIPSKHIYSKNFDPVVDNNIDKVEIQAQKPQIINDSGLIYNERITNSFVQEKQVVNSNQDERILDQQGRYWQIAYVEILAYPTYTTKTYKIPKSENNSRILSVFVGTDENNNPNIQYSIVGDIKNGTTTGIASAISPLYPYVSGARFTISTTEINNSIQQVDLYQHYDLYNLIENNNLLSYTHQYNSPTGTQHSVSTSVNLPQKIDVFNANVDTEDENYYYITFSILCGLRIFKAGGDYTPIDISTSQYPDATEFPLNGVYEEYDAKEVNVSFYGTTIKLDLQENNLSIGIGENLSSFEGNELMQTTNTPNMGTKYQGIIEKWKNGKQTAVISCPITDYYDTNVNKAIDISTNGKMLFQEGDIVIPYTYTNKGDKPLSYNKDFAPKQFKIVGTRISKKQGGLQELTLQEV